jgi:hypothetical protein
MTTKNEHNTVCPRCRGTRHQITKEGRTRRGDRLVTYPARFWSCPQCHDPATGEQPFVYADMEQLDANQAAARSAWQRKFSEPMPPRRKGGAPRKREPREHLVPVRMTGSELENLDKNRGELSRGAFIRRQVFGCEAS